MGEHAIKPAVKAQPKQAEPARLGSKQQLPQISSIVRSSSRLQIQPKLSIGAADDEYEREADRVAEQVMRMPDPQAERQSARNFSRNVAHLIQRQCADCEDQEELLQTKTADGSSMADATAEVASGVNALHGRGAPLPDQTRQFFESRFGTDFSAVRVHHDSQTAGLARAVNARAFTAGSDVAFSQGEYSPDTMAGKKLLAHELTHVLQQRGPNLLARQQGSTQAPPPAAPAFSITQIPGIMSALSWTQAAALLNDWFSRPANSSPTAGTPNTSAVTVSWANGFSRARSVYDQLIADRIWVNEPARNLLQSRLVSAGLPGHGASRGFGTVSGSGPALESEYINYRVVNQGWFNDLDGLAGALANFVYRVVARGTITDVGESPWYAFGTSRSYQVDVSDIGIYIKDSFDFNGDQDLGCWDPTANTVGRFAFTQANATCVDNADFRAWRAANSRGGDFLVYSPPETISVSDNFTFHH